MQLRLDVAFKMGGAFRGDDQFDSSDGRVVRAFASGDVDSGLISSRIKPMTLKLVFTASLLDAQH